MPHHFTKSMIYTNDPLGPPSPYVGEGRHTAKVSSRTSSFTVGNGQEYCVTDLGECKVNPIGGDELTDAKWMDGKRGAESACLRWKTNKHGGNQFNSKVDNECQSKSFCQY